ncbi:hypothetical protein EDD99_8120 [Streptomyces sp. 846.5]|nr:hypothetical protein [Streptomyces sp. 846.5]TDT93311.1 hypothetical protein EDD99_8120 [Streptomyces sp. 846.5]
MSETTAPATVLTPLEVLAAASAVIRVRGYFQPLSRQWEAAVPTAMDTERLVFGWQPHQRGDRALFAAQAEAAAVEAAAVLAWCAEGEPGNGYRASLARIVRAGRAAERDIPLLCSAVNSYRRDQHRAAITADKTADAEQSRHQGAMGDRVTVTATVAVVVDLGSRTYGYRVQPRLLVKFRDAAHTVYVWQASTGNVPKQGDRVEVTGTVSAHGTYQGIAQTSLTRCRWTPAKD